jgi:hypothetical protein
MIVECRDVSGAALKIACDIPRIFEKNVLELT